LGAVGVGALHVHEFQRRVAQQGADGIGVGRDDENGRVEPAVDQRGGGFVGR